MRYLQVSLFALLGAAVAAPTYAADPGTYRPGTPYYSTQASSADTCENQCAGDAQCKGWNFVRVNPKASTGVCEFNSSSVSPVPSVISISGDNGPARHAARLTAGGTHTVRVGSPASPAPSVIPARTAPTPQQQPKHIQSPHTVRPGARAIRPGQTHSEQVRPQQVHQRRRVIREPSPRQVQPNAAAYRTPNRAVQPPSYPQPQPVQRPRFLHNLDSGHQAAPQRRAQPQAPRPPMARQRPPSPMTARPAVPQTPGIGGDPRLQRMAQQAAVRHHATPPQMPALRSAPVSAPPQPPVASSMPPQPPAAMRPPQTVAEAEASLFGSLHDDVKAPKPITAAEAANPDAPIATVQAVPTKRVTTENLLGLAGAPPR